MTDDTGANTGRHILEPLEQAGSLLGGALEAETAAYARGIRADARGRMRLGVCLVVSAALHGLVLLGLPFPRFEGQASAEYAVRVRLIPGLSERREPGAELPAPGRIPEPAGSSAFQDPPTDSNAQPPAEPRDAEPRDAASENAPVSETGAAGPEIPPAQKPAALGTHGAESRLPIDLAADRAAALLLARVEAALVYPEAARLRGTEGVVGLKIFLDAAGDLADLKILRSSGSALLDRAARQAVTASLPVPNPSAAPLTFELAVRFALKKGAAPQEPPQ